MLRSRDPAGIEQEIWALLAVYQALRMAMIAAAESAGADPDRASFTIALEAARDQVTQPAASRTPQTRPTPAGWPCRPGRLAARPPPALQRPQGQMLHLPLPRPRRERGQDRPCQSVAITRVQVTIRVRPRTVPPRVPPANQPPGTRPLCPGSRRDQVTRIMASQPGQDWSGEDSPPAGVKPPNLLTQLAEWTRLGFLSKTGRGRYTLPRPAAPDGAATDSAGP